MGSGLRRLRQKIGEVVLVDRLVRGDRGARRLDQQLRPGAQGRRGDQVAHEPAARNAMLSHQLPPPADIVSLRKPAAWMTAAASLPRPDTLFAGYSPNSAGTMGPVSRRTIQSWPAGSTSSSPMSRRAVERL